MDRRKGKHNKGGGKKHSQQGGKGGRGGKSGHKGDFQGGKGGAGGWSSSKKGDDYDMDYLMEGPIVNAPFSNHRPPRERNVQPPPKARPKVKTEMQLLTMSRENQEMVKETLQSLRMEEIEAAFGEDVDSKQFGFEDGETEYDELDYRTENQYWMTENKLVIEEATSNRLSFGNDEQEGASPPVVNTFAVNKLQRCGFTKEHCLEALQICDGDTGAALEYLLNDLFDIVLDPEAKDDGADVDWEILDAREEEKLALESMFDNTFEERIPGKVWLLNLELPEMKQVIKRIYPTVHTNSKFKSKEPVIDNSRKTKKLPVCSFFLKGNCKFKDGCRFSHTPNVTEPKDKELSHPIYDNLKEVEDEKTPVPFSIEIRFPEGNRYPEEPPLVAFSSVLGGFPSHAKLNVSKFLLKEARKAAQDQIPCVFTLVSLLENVETLEEILAPSCRPNIGPSSTQNGTAAPLPSLLDLSFPESYKKIPPLLETPKPDPSQTSRRPEKNSTSFEHLKKAPKMDHNSNIPPDQLKKSNELLRSEFKSKQKSRGYLNMLAERQKLPAWEMRQLITEVIGNNRVTVISGMTGCGKTTQVPQFILDEALQQKEFNANIICTQPRRISAMAVAQRVADERCERLGKSVGYSIRLENVTSQQTRLLFCTTGIILRRLECDPELKGVSHIIIDEVHERSEESDFLLMILRDVLEVRPDLKVILMSATLNAQLFSEYYYGCPVLEIPGRTFPVQQLFLEDALELTNYKLEGQSPYAKSGKRQKNMFDEDSADEVDFLQYFSTVECAASNRTPDMDLSLDQLKARYKGHAEGSLKTLLKMDLEKINNDLIIEILEYIVSPRNKFEAKGAILIFLPGFAEIQSLYDAIRNIPVFLKNPRRYDIIPLHSTLSSEDQNSVFKKSMAGVTKIVIATNIAETSITIDDVVYVIDTGRMKEKRYDQSKSMESLETVWVSKANALQRQGRAGRVQEGVCFHLFTSHQFRYQMRHQPIPEIKRAPLEQLVLKIKILPAFTGRRVESVLEKLIEPPTSEAITGAIRRLQDLGALDSNKDLSAIGYHLASLPVDVRIGKLMLYGAIFRCLDSALTIAAALSFRSPFNSPFGLKQEADLKKKEFAMGQSDFLTILNAYKMWIVVKKISHGHAYKFCRENFLSMKTMQMISSLKQHYVELLSDIGFIRPGIRLRDVERAGKDGSDGVAEIIGAEGNLNADNWSLMSGMLVAALYPNVLQVCTPETRYQESSAGAVIKAAKSEDLRFKTKQDGYVSVHPTSVCFNQSQYASPFLVFHEKIKTSKVYIRDCSMVSVYQLLLFGGGSISIDLYKGSHVISVCDGWILFKASSVHIAELVRDLRHELDQLLSDKISQPSLDLLTCPRGSKIINCIVSLITSQ